MIHAWLTMQCVAKEPNFAHYYSTSYRYELPNVEHTNLEDYSNFETSTINIFERIDKKRDYHKSPKKYNYRAQKKRDVKPENKAENVGLYRNLNDDNKYSKDTGNRLRDRKIRKNVEPVVWSLSSADN